MRWGCREGFGRRLYGVGVLRVLGLGLRVYGVGFGVWAVPGRDGGRDGRTEGGLVWQYCVQEGGMERGREGEREGESVCGSTVSSCVCKKHSKRRSCIETALARLVQPGSIDRDAIVHISPPPPTRL